MLKLGLLIVCCVYTARAAEKCCAGDVCFNNNPPFVGLPLPSCAEEISPTMTLFTRSQPAVGQPITRDTIPPIFNGNNYVTFIVHGWMGSKDNRWLVDLKDKILERANYNVITVGWSQGSQQIWYPQSASDTRTVGTEIGLVAANLIANGNSANTKMYCVGHSLGSHICGHAGMKTKFGRVTGLDPAGPLFENRDWTCGLNPSSANLVDVIHTNGEPGVVVNLGTMKILGHVDFYPNGGGRQPGCLLDPLKGANDNDLKRGGVQDANENRADVDLTPACSHMRAIYYYRDSILTPCFLSRHICTDQYNLPASCTTGLLPYQSLGFEADLYGARGIFYLQTESTTPYCLN